MKKKLLMLAMAAIVTVNLSACAIGDTGLSDDELKQVAEYAAKLVLKHTRNYEPTLQEELSIKENPNIVNEDFNVAGKSKVETSETSSSSSINDEEENDKTENENPDDKSKDINETNDDKDTAATLNDIYAKEGFEVVYGGAGEYSRYPKNEGYFSLVAADNMKLYVVEFSIRNKTDKSRKFSHSEGVSYNLTFDGENYYKPSLTLLENDMQSIEVNIGGGKSSKGVIVFNVAKNESKTKAKLRIINGDKSYTLNVTQ
ncbi:hypothetical protein GCWU000282_00872 [Catonella morbi ATCC 51271]|jgi:hypothetical protein|uniref:DUF4352 domain-containing protein n=1 Tax=Catonella morbi ATCC 51271 TaxID=592026 RepID=V2Y6J3_9FIRM|nr:hypothetical protein [Catonella morbi]ESL03707.1 hypothetical protein GCWU000282_00872 [Catonella morbi ATCC 51271]